MLKDVDLQKYQEDGFLVVHHFFTQDQVQLLLENWRVALAQIQSGEASLERVDRFLFGTLPSVIANLYKDEKLVEVAHQVLRTQDIALYMTRILMKDERWNGAVATHQEVPYFHGGMNKLVAFVPLQTHNEMTGGLKLVKGSHRYGNLGRGAIEHEQFPDLEVVSPSLEVGDVMFMDFCTWHYSEAAKISCNRPLMQIAYQPATDGSYYSLEGPTLVSGQWQTRYFTKFGDRILQDVAAPGEIELKKKDAEIAQLKADLEQAEAHYHAEIAQLKANLEQAEAHYQTCLNQQAGMMAQLEGLEAIAQITRSQIAAMESSKFWKLRNSWLRLKQLVRPEK